MVSKQNLQLEVKRLNNMVSCQYTVHCYLNLEFNASLASGGDLCHLLITFANSLDPDQDRLKVGPDLDPNRFTLK